MRLLIVVAVVLLACSASASTRDSLYGSTWFEDNWIGSAAASVNHASDSVLLLVASGGTVSAKATIRILDSIYKYYKNRNVLACTLGVYCLYENRGIAGVGIHGPIRLNRILQRYVATHQTWNKYDSVSATDSSWKSVGISASSNFNGGVFPYMYDALYGTANRDYDITTDSGMSWSSTGASDSLTTATWLKIPVTYFVRGLSKNQFASNGWSITPTTNETSDTAKIASTEYDTASKRPYLILVWDTTSYHEKYVRATKFFKDTWINSGAATTNYGTGDTTATRSTSSAWAMKQIMGFPNCDSATGDTDYTGPGMILDSGWFYNRIKSAATSTSKSLFLCVRPWTETGATWNTYDGTNNWGTAGAENSTSDYITTDSIGSTLPTSADSWDSTKITTWLKYWYTNSTYPAAQGFIRFNRSSLTKSFVWRSNDNSQFYKPYLRIWFHDQPVATNNYRRRRMGAMGWIENNALNWRENYCVREYEQ